MQENLHSMFSYCSEWQYPLPKDHAEVIFLACVLLIKAISVSSPLSKSLIEGLLTHWLTQFTAISQVKQKTLKSQV